MLPPAIIQSGKGVSCVPTSLLTSPCGFLPKFSCCLQGVARAQGELLVLKSSMKKSGCCS